MQNINQARILDRSGLFRYIKAEDHKSAAEELNVHVVKFVNNQVIIRQNEKASQVAIVIDGAVKGEKIHGAGSGNMVHTFAESQMFGYEGVVSEKRVSPIDYISDGDSWIAFIDIEDIYNSSFAKELMQGLVSCLADDSIRKMHRIEMISKKKLRDRIMTCLRIQAEESGSSVITINLSREQLANELCVNRSALSNELSAMQSDGLIKIDKRKITLL